MGMFYCLPGYPMSSILDFPLVYSRVRVCSSTIMGLIDKGVRFVPLVEWLTFIAI